ncbi:MAG TPA: undecaprenyl-diphosphate phosphatase [Pirellulales bacterium]|nr:undecaprenyl-diphosphate phosphatase [Pirellulales bacterium]
MDHLRIVVLGIVQGITEFLPISSDGHLVVAGRIFALTGGPSLDHDDVLETIILHLGTLVAILAVYWREIWRIVVTDRRVIGLLVVGTLPAAVVGLLLKKYCEVWLTNPVLTGAMLPLNGLVLFWIGSQDRGQLNYIELTYRQALWIGLCQAAAPLPGISRSGTTIAGGLAVGLKRADAATFSFLLAIPAISGAAVVALVDLLQGRTTASTPAGLALGAAVSFLVGVVALRLFLRWLKAGRLNVFAWWCIALGTVLLVWQLGTAKP